MIEVEDNGTGISNNDLIRMTKRVGESRSKDDDYQLTKRSMPYWLKPTGAFGIGLQSLFLVTNTFTIHTKSESEKSKEILFYSAKKNDYSRITREEPKMNRGTKVIIEIPKNQFSKVFSNTFENHLIDNYDIFTDKYGDIYLHKMREYIFKEFKEVELLNVNFFKEPIIISQINKNTDERIDIKKSKMKREENLLVLMSDKLSYPQSNVFLIYENMGIGSYFIFMFYNFFPQTPTSFYNPNIPYYPYPTSAYLVRDIPINEEKFPSFYKTRFFYTLWNFQSPESDKILNISRDKFISKKEREFNNIFLEKILPEAVKNILVLFEKKHLNNVEEKFAIEYFHIGLTSGMCKLKFNNIQSIFGEHILPSIFATTNNLADIKLKDFFSAKKVLKITKQYLNNNADRKETLQNVYTQLNQEHHFETDFIMWNNHLETYFNISSFILLESLSFIHKKDDPDEGKVLIEIFSKAEDQFQPVKTNDLQEKIILNGITYINRKGNRRSAIIPLEKYGQLYVDKNFDSFPPDLYNVRQYIISPFRNTDEIIQFKNDVNQLIDDEKNINSIK